nr:protein FAM169B isoform X2 [Peromyscus maniculatus bairdii]
MEAEAAPRATEAYPVDILEDDPEGHQSAAQVYYDLLREGGSAEVFSLATGEQVRLETPFLHYCTMYRDEPRHKILVLVNPQDTKTVVAVYLKESWWSIEDVLRTSDPAREGLMKVQSFGERIVLYVLNTIVFGRLERDLDDDDMFFLPHPAKEQAKILWRDGAAVGFYSIKMKGSLCGTGTSACYLLPVFDTVFVRRKNRCRGLGTAMLKDFCDTFRAVEGLGISCPISPAMYKVLKQFLLAHPGERGRLWEVESPGAWGQRVNIWLNICLQEAGLHDGSTVHPEGSEEDTDTPRQTSRGDGPTPVHHGESPKGTNDCRGRGREVSGCCPEPQPPHSHKNQSQTVQAEPLGFTQALLGLVPANLLPQFAECWRGVAADLTQGLLHARPLPVTELHPSPRK